MRRLLFCTCCSLLVSYGPASAQTIRELSPTTYTGKADVEPAPEGACVDQSGHGFVLSNEGRLLLEERTDEPRVRLRRGGVAEEVETGPTPTPTLNSIVAAVPSRLAVTLCGQFGKDLAVVNVAIFPQLDHERYAMPTRITVPSDTLKLKMSYEISDGKAVVENSIVAATTQNLEAAVIDRPTGQETKMRFAFLPVTGPLAELLFGSKK